MTDERQQAAVDAPTELPDGVDRLEAFADGVARSAAVFHRVGPREVEAVLVDVLRLGGAHRVALAADLGPSLDVARAACAVAVLDAVPYTAVAADRVGLEAVDTAITGCAAALASTGSIVTTAAAGRGSALTAARHVCIVRADQVLSGLAELLRVLRRLAPGSMTALQTGPSRTADIEKVLVLGAHGPCEVTVILVDDKEAAA
jgi:L-lactate dehydrogenase complex protein LldG